MSLRLSLQHGESTVSVRVAQAYCQRTRHHCAFLTTDTLPRYPERCADAATVNSHGYQRLGACWTTAFAAAAITNSAAAAAARWARAWGYWSSAAAIWSSLGVPQFV